MIGHLRIIESGAHLDQRSATPKSFVSGHRTHNHFGDSVKNPALPIVIVLLHFGAVLGVLFEGALFYAPQVGITNILVVLHQFSNNLLSRLVEVLRKLSDAHNLLASEIDRFDQYCILYILNLLFNVVGMLKNTAFRFFEGLNTVLALPYKFWDRE